MTPNILNYTELCSNALLSIVDNDESDIIKNDHGEFEIEISKKFISSLLFYTKSLSNHYSQFGKTTVIIKSCHPNDNWRKAEEQLIGDLKFQYLLTDGESFKIDLIELDVAIEKNWVKLRNRMEEHIFVQQFDIDYYDWLTLFKNFNIGGSISTVHPTQAYFVTDANSHYDHTSKIPDKIKTKAEIVLRKEKLI